MRPEDFGADLLAILRRAHPNAAALTSHRSRGGVEIGVQDGAEFVPLLRLTGASAACNVMSLLVRQGRGWAPTFLRGTPAELGEPLAGPLHHLWSLAVLAADPPEKT